MNANQNAQRSNLPLKLWISPADFKVEKISKSGIEILSDIEQQRYYSLKSLSSQQQFLTAHILLRFALTDFSDKKTAPGDWQFIQNRYGKPEIDPASNLPDLKFNLSHCDGAAVVAITHTCPVGIDVEPLDGRLDSELFKIYLSANEYRRVMNHPTAARSKALLQLWTLKEAYLKMTGSGLTEELSAIDFTPALERMQRSNTGGVIFKGLYIDHQIINIAERSYSVSVVVRSGKYQHITIDVYDKSVSAFLYAQYR